jgi:hypothetical protein
MNCRPPGGSAPPAVGATSGARASPQTEDAPSARASLVAKAMQARTPAHDPNGLTAERTPGALNAAGVPISAP